MTYTDQFIFATTQFQKIAQQTIGGTAERWLNIAYKLDYISLDFKEKIDALLKRKDEMQRFNFKQSVSNQDVMDMITITEIASNTKFSPRQLKNIEYG